MQNIAAQSTISHARGPRRAQLIRQLRDHKLDPLKVGKELGMGAMKTAYDLPGTGCALITTPPVGWTLDAEIINLERLRKAGVPAAKILDVGNYRGSQAMVMKKYEDVMKPVPPDISAMKKKLQPATHVA